MRKLIALAALLLVSASAHAITTCYYAVAAYNEDGESDRSNEVLKSFPGLPHKSPPLSWTVPGGNYDGSRVYWGCDASGEYTDSITLEGAELTTYIVDHGGPDPNAPPVYRAPGKARVYVTWVRTASGNPIPMSLTLHVDASDADKVFTTYVEGGPHTGTPDDDDPIQVWEHDTDPDIILWYEASGNEPAWQSTSSPMLLPSVEFASGKLLGSYSKSGFGLAAGNFLAAGAKTGIIAVHPTSITASASNSWENQLILGDINNYFGLLLKDESGTKKALIYNWDGDEDAAAVTVDVGKTFILAFRHGGGTLEIRAVSVDGDVSDQTSSGDTADLTGRLRVGNAFWGQFIGNVGELELYDERLGDEDFDTRVSQYAAKWLPSGGGGEEEGAFAAEADFGAAFAASVVRTASFSAGAEMGATWSARVDAIAALHAGIEAAETHSGQASILVAIVEALEAGEAQSSANLIPAALQAGIEANEQYVALADALAAIQSGLEAGETWAGIAATEAGLLAGAEVESTFAGDIGLSVAAFSAGTEAAAQFIGAAAAFGLMQAGVTAADAYSVAGATSAALSAGADADAVFAALSGKRAAVSAGAEMGAAMDVLASYVGVLSARADMESAFSGIAAATATVTAGVILGSTFSAESSADPDPPMRRIVRAVQEVRAVRVPGKARVVRVH